MISAYELRTGRQAAVLRGHMATINACCWCPRRSCLLSGSRDRNLLLWAPHVADGAVCAAGYESRADEPMGDRDAWSDDEAPAGVSAAGAAFSGGRQVGGTDGAPRHRGGWRGARRPRVQRGGVTRGQRAAQASTRIRRIAARLISALQPHMGAEPSGGDG